MLSKRAWALAAAGALIAAAWLETAQNNPQIIGPFALTWLAETHPVSPENQALFSAISLPAPFPARIELAADVGCGCGVFGLSALRTAANNGTVIDEMIFSDPHQPSLAALARTLTRHAPNLPMLSRATLSDASLLDALHSRRIRAGLICANLPQTPAPSGFRLDRWGGADGADLICRFLDELPQVLAVDGVAFLLHIGLAHPARVAATMVRNRFDAVVLAEQTRHARFADYEAMQPGLADHLRAECAAGRAQWETDADGTGFRFQVRLLRLSLLTQSDTARRPA